MKKLIIALMFMLSACTDKTEFGNCIGAFDDTKPDLIYKVSTKNVIIAVLFSETVIVPVVVILDQVKCPVGVKTN